MNLENQIVILISTIFMLLFSILELRSYKKSPFKDYKSVIVSIGVLGTFVGVVLGLWDFDSHNVKESIPALLDGLKLAFITSIIGMLLSILLSAKSISKGNKVSNSEELLSDILKQLEEKSNKESSDKLNLLEVLSEIKNEIKSQNKLIGSNFKITIKKLDKLNLLDELNTIKSITKEQSETLNLISSKVVGYDKYLVNIEKSNKVFESDNNKQIELLSTINYNLRVQEEKLNKLNLLDELINIKNNNQNIMQLIDDKVSSISTNSNGLKKMMFNVFSDISKIKDNSGQQVEATKSINTTMIEKSDDINKSITNNSSLMQKLLTDKLNNITISLEKAVESLSKGATEEIIKALEQVISDFNSNLTEQFGENFKELNQAVFDLLKWQENYKTQVIDFENSLQNTLSNVEESNNKSIVLFKKETKYAISIFEKLTKSTEYIEKITKDYEKISKVSIELEEILKANNMQIKDFEIHTETLAKIGEDARLITNEIRDFSQIVIGSLSNQSEQLSKQSQSVTEMMNEIEEKLPQSLEILNRNLTSLSEHFTENYQILLKNLLAEDRDS